MYNVTVCVNLHWSPEICFPYLAARQPLGLPPPPSLVQEGRGERSRGRSGEKRGGLQRLFLFEPKEWEEEKEPWKQVPPISLPPEAIDSAGLMHGPA